MKTTLELPDDLMRTIKMRAASEDRRLKDVIAELLRRGLAEAEDSSARSERRISLPLIVTGRPADPKDEITPERIAEILAEEDAEAARW